MSGTHRDKLFLSRSRCFACKNHRWGLWPTETCNSSPKVPVLHAQNHRRGLEPVCSIYSCAKHAVMCAQNHRWGLGPIDSSNSDANHPVLHAKRIEDGWDPYRLVILMLIPLFYMHKTIGLSGTHRDMLFLSRSRCFACKNHRWGLWPTETCNSSPKVPVLHAQNHKGGLYPVCSIYSCAKHAVMCAQNHRWGLGPIETCKSGHKVAVLHEKQTQMRAGTH